MLSACQDEDLNILPSLMRGLEYYFMKTLGSSLCFRVKVMWTDFVLLILTLHFLYKSTIRSRWSWSVFEAMTRFSCIDIIALS